MGDLLHREGNAPGAKRIVVLDHSGLSRDGRVAIPPKEIVMVLIEQIREGLEIVGASGATLTCCDRFRVR
jgi:hypothetical protein